MSPNSMIRLLYRVSLILSIVTAQVRPELTRIHYRSYQHGCTDNLPAIQAAVQPVQ